MDWCARPTSLRANKVRFHRVYAVIATAIFLIEVCIALFVRDSFVRPVLGDVLAVMLVYCGVLAIVDLRPAAAALLAFAVGATVEALQYGNALTHLGLERVPIARIVLGTTFSWGDIVAYSVGAIVAFAADIRWRKASTLS